MSQHLVPALLLPALLATAGLGVDAPKGPAPRNFAKLVEQLGHSDFRRRDEASDKLQAAGPAALPALRKALNHTDPEVRRRVTELVPAIETAALLAPRRVTLKVDKKPLRDIEELSRQTEFKIEPWSSTANQVYSFDFVDAPFWEAFDRICLDSGMVLQAGYGDDRLRLQQQNAHAPFIYYDGPFRFVANGLQHYRNVDFSLIGRGARPSRRSESMTFTFSLFVEPRLPILGIGDVKLIAAFDSEKNSMLSPTSGSAEGLDIGLRQARSVSRYGNGYRAYHMQAQVNLNRPSEKATAVRVLRGTVPVTLLAQQNPVVVTDAIMAAKGKKFTVGPTSFSIEDANEQPNKQYQLKLSVTENNRDNPNDYTWMNALYQRIELQDARGNKFQVFGSNWGNSGPNNVQLTLTYGANNGVKIGPPTKFVYYAWTTLQHQVAFEFKDLPLP